MPHHIFRIALALGPILVAAAGAQPVLAQNAPLPTSGQFWACDPGFSLQTSGNAVRCAKPGQRVETDPGNCLPPSQRRVDHRGLVDACVAGPIAGDMVCVDPTTRKEVRRGLDVCVKNTAADFRQPTVRVTRN